MTTPGGILATCSYVPPASPAECRLDVVTVTFNRPEAIKAQGARLGPQLSPADRWIVVDDAPNKPAPFSDLAHSLEHPEAFMGVRLSYVRNGRTGTVNQAREAGCRLARPDAWIVEVDDHDIVEPDALAAVRDAICRGAVFVYGDVQWCTEDGRLGRTFRKPDYHPYLFRDEMCPAEGVRAFPKWLYEAAGGYRWSGEPGLHKNEFPAGDYALYTRMELLTCGTGFYRIPCVLNHQPKVEGGISTRYGQQQLENAIAIREAAQNGTLL